MTRKERRTLLAFLDGIAVTMRLGQEGDIRRYGTELAVMIGQARSAHDHRLDPTTSEILSDYGCQIRADLSDILK